MRFRLDRDISEKLGELGFEKNAEFDSCDVIFEPKEWYPGDGMRLGYFIVRIRLKEKEKPRIEMKEYLKEDLWNETSLEISSPNEMIKMLSSIMNLRRCISKHRTIWKKENIEICLDDVEHLGKFIEIEGEERKAYEIMELLGFDISQKQPPYGALLFYLERDGKLKFSADEIIKNVERFNNNGIISK